MLIMTLKTWLKVGDAEQAGTAGSQLALEVGMNDKYKIVHFSDTSNLEWILYKR